MSSIDLRINNEPWHRSHVTGEESDADVQIIGDGPSRFWIMREPNWEQRAARLTDGTEIVAPSHFFAGGFADSDFPAQVEYTVERGEIECQAIIKLTGGPPLTGALMRTLALKEFTRRVVESAIFVSWGPPGATPVWVKPSTFGRAGAEHVSRALRPQRSKQDGRLARAITDEYLKDVARVYRTALGLGLNPVAAVKAELHVARSTAGRHVGLARKQGYLRPTTRGKAGEQSDADRPTVRPSIEDETNERPSP
jgi:hypothetical protein